MSRAGSSGRDHEGHPSSTAITVATCAGERCCAASAPILRRRWLRAAASASSAQSGRCTRGWVREGADPIRRPRASVERRRSLLGRLRGARRGGAPRGRSRPDRAADSGAAPPPASHRRAPSGAAPGDRRRDATREPRHVRAIPTSAEQKAASGGRSCSTSSEHPRTLAGVARSLGSPTVSVLPLRRPPELVNVVGVVGAVLVPLRGRPPTRCRRGASPARATSSRS